jgi:hypothetical protein
VPHKPFKIGSTATGDSAEKWNDNEALSNWFHEEAGLQFNLHMSAATRRELAHVATTMSPGRLDRGGMWEMERTVAQQKISAQDPLQITGTMKMNITITKQRRRRK